MASILEVDDTMGHTFIQVHHSAFKIFTRPCATLVMSDLLKCDVSGMKHENFSVCLIFLDYLSNLVHIAISGNFTFW